MEILLFLFLSCLKIKIMNFQNIHYLKPDSPKHVVERFISMFGSDDLCINCNSEMVKNCCDKCGDGVCMNDTCCMVFPHHCNTSFTICNNCIKIIDSKLHLVIDMGKLESLKRKILKSETVAQMRMSISC